MMNNNKHHGSYSNSNGGNRRLVKPAAVIVQQQQTPQQQHEEDKKNDHSLLGAKLGSLLLVPMQTSNYKSSSSSSSRATRLALSIVVVILWYISFEVGCHLKLHRTIIRANQIKQFHEDEGECPSSRLQSDDSEVVASASSSSSNESSSVEENMLPVLPVVEPDEQESCKQQQQQKEEELIVQKTISVKQQQQLQLLLHDQITQKAQQLVHPSMMTSFEHPKHVALLLDLDDSSSLLTTAVWKELLKYQTLTDVTFVILSGNNSSTNNNVDENWISSIVGAAAADEETDDSSSNGPRVHVARLSSSKKEGEENLEFAYEYVTSFDENSDMSKLFDVVLWLDPYANGRNLNLKFKNSSGAQAEWNESRLYKISRYLSSNKMKESALMGMPLGPSPISLNRHNSILVQLQTNLINIVGGGECYETHNNNNNNNNDTATTSSANNDQEYLLNFIESHIYESPSYYTKQQQHDSFVIFCKNTWCRNHRALEQEGFPYLQHLMTKRLHSRYILNDDSFSFFDIVSFIAQARPPKVWETLYCSSSSDSHKDQCDFFNGYSPQMVNVYHSDCEVKQSSLGPHVGRGLFTNHDITAGSLLMAEQMAHYIKFKPHMNDIIEQTYKIALKTLSPSMEDDDDEDDDEQDDDEDDDDDDDDEEYNYLNGLLRGFEILDNYIDSYPYADYTYGDYGWTGDAGYAMFSNHGCHPHKRQLGNLSQIYKNIVYQETTAEQLGLPENEAPPSVVEQPKESPQSVNLKPLFYWMSNPNGSLFNPLMDRRYGREIASEGVVQSAQAGDELFSNYLSYSGEDPKEWAKNAKDLWEQCNQKKAGRVVQVDYLQH